jgi:hypothetical protein
MLQKRRHLFNNLGRLDDLSLRFIEIGSPVPAILACHIYMCPPIRAVSLKLTVGVEARQKHIDAQKGKTGDQ